mmetsp:Transcript_30332/g.34978  ORF Transcript_30332/g.34978 Transcript_30332/m.34978 type:complete len:85 (-) Transcript_30332:300-554(-)
MASCHFVILSLSSPYGYSSLSQLGKSGMCKGDIFLSEREGEGGPPFKNNTRRSKTFPPLPLRSFLLQTQKQNTVIKVSHLMLGV